MRFVYIIEYVAGKNSRVADTLSRAPLSEVRDADEYSHANSTEKYIQAVIKRRI